MSAPSQKKRPADQDLQSPLAKRPANKSQQDDEVVQFEVEDDFEINVALHPKFKVFPDALRTAIEKTYASAARSQMAALASNRIQKHKYTYSVVTERVVPQSGNGRNRAVIKLGFLTLSQSNTFLLTEMLRVFKDKIAPKSKFVRLERKSSFNPKFCYLHSVRHGEVGWGFDANGCLSMHVPFIEKDEKYEYNIYVERMVVKVEDKAA